MSDGSPHLGLSARLLAHPERGVRRISFDIEGEQVTFSVRAGAVSAVCTCARESCEHYQAALAFFGDEPSAAPITSLAPRHRSSLRPPPLQAAAEGLAEALDELCLATVRAGVSARESPSIRAALEQVTSAASGGASLSLARFVGRFRNALELGEVGKLARLLSGAQAFAAEIRQEDRSRDALSRKRVWLGVQDGDAPAALTDVVLIEIGREWLSGLSRSAIERRYLVELGSGELYCEERRRGEQDISVGPCPRVVHVAFAEVETATAPARARLLQYTVSPEPSASQWERLAELGEKSLAALAARYAADARRCPGLSEPMALFAASELSAGPMGALRDEAGGRISLRDDGDGELVDAVRALVGGDQLVWALGRLRGLARGLTFRPVSVLVRAPSGLSLRRVT